MIDTKVDYHYFKWISSKIDVDEKILYEMFITPFAWVILGDKNRAYDVKDLRLQYIDETGRPMPDGWVDKQPSSVLEVIYRFCQLADFETDIEARHWFARIVENLRLTSDLSRDHIRDILQCFIWREYEPNGRGGLFPLKNPKKDQRNVEIWYQFNAYLDDIGWVDSILQD